MKLKNRRLPAYSRDEEIANMVTHIAGAVFAVVSLFLCVIFSAWNRNVQGIISGLIYGISMTVVYVVSSVYHGLDGQTAFIATFFAFCRSTFVIAMNNAVFLSAFTYHHRMALTAKSFVVRIYFSFALLCAELRLFLLSRVCTISKSSSDTMAGIPSGTIISA